MLSNTLRLELPATAVFDYPTVSALAAFISTLHASEGAVPGGSSEDAGLADLATSRPAAPRQSRAALSAAEALIRVQRMLAGILGTDVSPDQPMSAAGLDSLAAVEVGNELAR